MTQVHYSLYQRPFNTRGEQGLTLAYNLDDRLLLGLYPLCSRFEGDKTFKFTDISLLTVGSQSNHGMPR